MNHEIATRGSSLISKFRVTRILVCGAGSLGGNLVDNLTRLQFENISVVDFDRVSNDNLATQPYVKSDIGKLKVSALSLQTYKNLGVKLKIHTSKLEHFNINKIFTESSPDIVVDCFDNTESRQLVFDYTQSHDIPCVHGGMVDGFGEVKWNNYYKIPMKSDNDVCDYPLTRTLINLVVARLVESIINYIDKSEQNAYHVRVFDGNTSIIKL
jgi:molybdopterin/thiamine biosynthesis adenylyltransferase